MNEAKDKSIVIISIVAIVAIVGIALGIFQINKSAVLSDSIGIAEEDLVGGAASGKGSPISRCVDGDGGLKSTVAIYATAPNYEPVKGQDLVCDVHHDGQCVSLSENFNKVCGTYGGYPFGCWCYSTRCYSRGYSKNPTMGYYDTCEGDILKEAYCKDKKTVAYKDIKCPYGCYDGACSKTVPVCGNQIIDGGEECDGSNFGKYKDCADYDDDFQVGELKCSPNCKKIDTSDCKGIQVNPHLSALGYKRGEQIWILWDVYGLESEAANIKLLKGGSAFMNIGDYESDFPFVYWTIPLDIPTGSDYSIRATSKVYPIFDDSDTFSIS